MNIQEFQRRVHDKLTPMAGLRTCKWYLDSVAPYHGRPARRMRMQLRCCTASASSRAGYWVHCSCVGKSPGARVLTRAAGPVQRPSDTKGSAFADTHVVGPHGRMPAHVASSTLARGTIGAGQQRDAGAGAHELTSIGVNCNCGTRLAFHKTGFVADPEACNRKCTANTKCKSFGIWTGGKKWKKGQCALFDAECLPDGSCADPTGYTNRVYNVPAATTADANAKATGTSTLATASASASAAANVTASRCSKYTNERFDHAPYDTDPCCTPEGKRCAWFHAVHRDNLHLTIPDCERKNLVSILKWFKKVVTGDWFVSDGTLLGAVRNGAFIPKDTDIDIMLDAAHADIVRKEIEQALGCTHFEFVHKTRPWRVSFSKTNEVCELTSAAMVNRHY